MIDPAAGGSSGIYLSQLFEKWGIADQVKAKAVLVPGGLVAERVMNGQADIAVHQISEILAVPGACWWDRCRPRSRTTRCMPGAVGAAAREPSAAQAFLQLLGSAEARAVLAQKGMEAP
jgi:molybdate transport system substrate-binding protein